MSREPLAESSFEIYGIEGEDCQQAVDRALQALTQRLPQNGAAILPGIRIDIGHNLTESGGEADPDTRRIVLDAGKNSHSLQETENLLVKQGILDLDDWIVVLPEVKDEPWSTLSYNIPHEVGHLLGGDLLPEFAPTQYGRDKPGEAFPEAFTYWIYGKPIAPEAEKAIREALDQNWGEL